MKILTLEIFRLYGTLLQAPSIIDKVHNVNNNVLASYVHYIKFCSIMVNRI